MLFVTRGDNTRMAIPYDVEMAGADAVRQYMATPPTDAVIEPYESASVSPDAPTDDTGDAAPRRGRTTPKEG